MNARRVNEFLAGMWLTLSAATLLHSAETFDSAYISEFLAVNERGEKDDDRERFGWIELHNGGRAAVNLNGWFLTDTATNFAKWRIPGVVLLPDKYLRVFASGNDRTNVLAELHTSFRLTTNGGYLALVNAATNVVSEFRFTNQLADVSFGRVRGEPGVTGAFLQPTPGRPNATSGANFAPAVKFSHPNSNFIEAFTLTLTTELTNAVIRFTLDGSFPNTSSPTYHAPLLITNTAHIRARAYAPGLLPGPPASAAYLKLFSNVVTFTSTLPVLVMDTFGRNIPVSERNAFVHLSLHEPVKGTTSLTNAPTLTTRAGFRVRGSTSSGFPQTPFAVEFVDEFNAERPLAPLDLPADSDWVLYAPNVYDMVMIHNPFVHQLSRDLGHWSPRTRFVEVFLSRSKGRVRDLHYQGIYVLTEKITIGKPRVNIERAGAGDLKPPKVTGGYVLKWDRLGPGEAGLNASGDRGLVYVEPKEEIMMLPQRAPQREFLKSYFADFERALNGPEWKDPAKGYRAFFDVPAAIDFHVLEVLSGNVDALVLSTYFYKPRKGKITYGPHWDFDRALGSTDGRDANPRQWQTGPFFGGAWWPRLFSDVDFWQAWVDRWHELRTTHFSLTNLNALIDRQCAELREAQPREFAKWNLQPRGGSYQGEINHMKGWLSNRIDFIDGQLTPRPVLSRPGGKVAPGVALTISAPTNTTIFYTLDGSDPRAAGGGIATNALTFTAPIALTTNAQVVARAHNTNQVQSGGPPVSTPWSGPVRAQFEVTGQ